MTSSPPIVKPSTVTLLVKIVRVISVNLLFLAIIVFIWRHTFDLITIYQDGFIDLHPYPPHWRRHSVIYLANVCGMLALIHYIFMPRSGNNSRTIVMIMTLHVLCVLLLSIYLATAHQLIPGGFHFAFRQILPNLFITAICILWGLHTPLPRSRRTAATIIFVIYLLLLHVDSSIVARELSELQLFFGWCFWLWPVIYRFICKEYIKIKNSQRSAI